jgi:hypothetical protein
MMNPSAHADWANRVKHTAMKMEKTFNCLKEWNAFMVRSPVAERTGYLLWK